MGMTDIERNLNALRTVLANDAAERIACRWVIANLVCCLVLAVALVAL